MNKDRKIIIEPDIKEILDKISELKRNNNETSLGRKILYIFGLISGTILIGFLCLTLYKNAFSVESLLSLLLAFFSIFISVFFYFKAADTSSDFYRSSYDFMKEVSVTLGKIEERFDAQLNSINEKMSVVTAQKKETEEDLEVVSEENQKIEEYLKKSELDDKAKQEYEFRLEKNNEEIASLQNEIRILNRKQREYERKIINSEELNYSQNKYINKKIFENKVLQILADAPNEYRQKLINGEINNEMRMVFRNYGIEIDDISKPMLRNIIVNKKY